MLSVQIVRRSLSLGPELVALTTNRPLPEVMQQKYFAMVYNHNIIVYNIWANRISNLKAL